LVLFDLQVKDPNRQVSPCDFPRLSASPRMRLAGEGVIQRTSQLPHHMVLFV